MVFVTVGTHEQQFNRLISTVDALVGEKQLCDTVFMQTGYCTYAPEYCAYRQFVDYSEMTALMRESDVVITHGGPSSFIEAMSLGKVPVVVPRLERFGEHVNDHQADFVRLVAERMGGIVPCFDVADLPRAIEEVKHMCAGESFKGNNAAFNDAFEKLIEEL